MPNVMPRSKAKRLSGAPSTRKPRRKLTRAPQLQLFLEHGPSVLGMFLLSSSSMRAFAQSLSATRPRYVFDLRAIPIFDGAGVNRRSMLRSMDELGCVYVDAAGFLGGLNQREALIKSRTFVDNVREVCGPKPRGPMFFIFQSDEELAWSHSFLPRALSPVPRGGWRVHVSGVRSADLLRDEFYDAQPAQPWELGDTLYVIASPSETTGWLLDAHGRPAEPINLKRGSTVRVEALQIGEWTDVLVLAGHHRGSRLRLASNAHVARLVR